MLIINIESALKTLKYIYNFNIEVNICIKQKLKQCYVTIFF